MPFPQPFMRVVASGGLLGGAEQWSCSLSFSREGFEQGNTDAQGMADGAAEAWTDFFNAVPMRPETSLDLVKANVIDVDGTYLSDSVTIFRDVDPPVRGSSTGNPFPPQIAVVLSLLTARQRGRGSRGRIYLPSMVLPVDARTGVLAPATTELVATAGKALIDALNDVNPSQYRCVVASDLGQGVLEPVTRVAVGSVLDTQRRRRSSIAETYFTASLST